MRTSSLILLSSILTIASALKISKHTSSTARDPEGKPVFYVIVMGDLAYRHQISLWLSSLRKLGGFKDEVVLVTDKPGCLAKTLSEGKMLGPQISSDENVDIYGPGEGYVGNVHLMKRPEADAVFKMKREKMRAWKNVQLATIPHPVSSIIYCDEDIAIGKDLTEFVSVVRNLENQKNTLALFRDTGSPGTVAEMHTGVVVIFPGAATDKCLVAWSDNLTELIEERIRSGKPGWHQYPDDNYKKRHVPYSLKNKEEPIELGAQVAEESLELDMMGPDQRSLGAASACKKGDHAGINILPEKFFWFPTSSGLKSGRRAEFVHFTNSNRWKGIDHKVINKYLVNLGIPESIDATGENKDRSC